MEFGEDGVLNPSCTQTCGNLQGMRTSLKPSREELPHLLNTRGKSKALQSGCQSGIQRVNRAFFLVTLGFQLLEVDQGIAR